MNSNLNKVTRQVRIGQVVTGIQKYFMTLPAIRLAGTDYTPAVLIETLQEVLAVIKQTSNSKAAWLADVQTERNALGKIGPVLRYVKSFVIAQFGDTQDSSKTLEDFGYKPRKVRAKKVDTKAQAVEQGRATRVARSTRGPRQKAKIKGTVVTKPSTDGSATKAPSPAASTAPAPVNAPR
jgi:hypothetical protein